MCGIFAYVSKNNETAKLVLDGLKILEYRGYDSWGIASRQRTKDKELRTKFVVEKRVGKISDSVLSSQFSVPSSLAIGHTRWATHGGVTVENAHPHLDCSKKISVVHNGIVENFDIIKNELIKKGHKFLSGTDSEVIAHLIEEYSKTRGFATAVRDGFKKLKGMNAIVVANAQSLEIVAAKTGSPLVIGESDNIYYIASDASSILPKTNKLLFLKDNHMAIIGKKVQILSLPDGEKQSTKFEKISWKTGEVNKGSFPHFMLKEINDQPDILRNIALTYQAQVTKLSQTINKAKGTYFIGAGTASYAGLAGTYFFSKIAGKHVNMSFASEFNYLLDFINKKSLVIALSQSGETIDVVEPLSKAKEKGATIATLVNTQGSTIYRMSDKKLLLGAGIEQAVASTKAFTAKTSILLMLSFALKGDLKIASNQLIKASDEIKRIIKDDKKLIPVVNLLSRSEHIYIIGRGISYPTSLEGALKIKETSYIHAEGLAGGELKHGALALIAKGTPCIVFAPQDETYESIISNATEIKTRGGVIIGISHKNHAVFDHWIEVKDCSDATSIAQIVPLQLIAYHLALKKGFDPDKPRNLAKSVTVK
jgi:glutamine---fructose-6-phosphate transaminase (isomerizing)